MLTYQAVVEISHCTMELENLNPNVYKKIDDRKSVAADLDDNIGDPFDEREVFGMHRLSTFNRHKSFTIVFLHIFVVFVIRQT